MAATIALRTWLVALGCGNDDNANAIIAQGLTDIQDLRMLNPTDVKVICDGARKPGGSTINATGVVVPNLGAAIPAILQTRLTLAVTAAIYYASVDRPISPAIMGWPHIRHFRDLNQINSNWTVPETLPILSKSLPIMKMIELLHGQFRKLLGVRMIPLAYVVRPSAAVEPIASAPLRPVASSTLPYSERFTGFHDEQILRASHTHPQFGEDNAVVLDIILNCLQTSGYMSSIKPFIRLRDGRGALLALEGQNLGRHKWDTVIQKAEHVVLRIKFNGNNPRFPLRRHVNNHRDAHNDMIRANDADGFDYQVPDERTRVQRFLHSLECKDPRIIAAKANVVGDPARENDFETAVEYFLQVAPPKLSDNNRNESHNVSVVGADGNTYTIAAVGTAKGNNTYKRHIFNKLCDDKKKELRAWWVKHEAGRKSKRQRTSE
jgi:hypothetical protein